MTIDHHAATTHRLIFDRFPIPNPRRIRTRLVKCNVTVHVKDREHQGGHL